MGGTLGQINDGDDVQLKGGTDGTLIGNAGDKLKIDGSGVTQPVSAASLPLPTGAATAANQSTANTSLASIDAGIPAALGQTTMSASMPVVIASDQSTISVTSIDGTKASYSACILGLVAAATPTDVFTLTGSSTKTIRVTYISFTATENTSTIRDLQVLKRSTANTGGTSTAPTAVPHDSTSAAATATVLAYTANPSALGALVGAIRIAKMDISSTNLSGSSDIRVWGFGTRPSQAIVLRGTSQVLAINLNAVTLSSNLLDICIEWTEES